MTSSEPRSETQLLQEIERLREELRDAQQMTALGQLVSTTTHEFNNVLTTILNYAKLGLRHTDDATRTRALEKILGAGQRAEKLTSSVLGLARNRTQEATPTDLGSLCDETLVLLERELQKYRVGVERRYEAQGLAMVVGNQIQQVLLNLLTNARQAMPKGGLVVIRVADDPEQQAVDLSVRDTGEGITMESLPKIFERGFSTKAGPDATGKGGAGLGLSEVVEMVEASGGKIRVESTVGKGTQFTLKMPRATQEALAGPTGQPVASLGVQAAATDQSAVG